MEKKLYLIHGAKYGDWHASRLTFNGVNRHLLRGDDVIPAENDIRGLPEEALRTLFIFLDNEKKERKTLADTLDENSAKERLKNGKTVWRAYYDWEGWNAGGFREDTGTIGYYATKSTALHEVKLAKIFQSKDSGNFHYYVVRCEKDEFGDQ